MEGDSDLEDYDLTVKDGIVPRTGAEERRMVDENNDQDMNAFAMTEQTLSSQTMMGDRLMEEGRRLRQLICRDPVQSIFFFHASTGNPELTYDRVDI